MLDPRSKDPIARQVRHPQIIVGGLVAGPLVFLAIVVVLVQQGFPAVAGIAPILTYVAVAHVVMAVLARVIVPNLIVARARRRIIQGTFAQLFARLFEQTGDAGRLFFVFCVRTIVGAAILESAAFMALITYLIEGAPVALILAVAMIIAVAAHFPTRAGVLHWIEDQLRLIEQEQQFGR